MNFPENIMLVYNKYRFLGGEETVVEAERELLEEHGHRVTYLCWDNKEIDNWSILGKASLLWRPTWSSEAYRRVFAKAQEAPIDIVHVHNFFPLASPSIFYACAKAKLPVVYTLHNYRILCANGIFLRGTQTCTKCRSALPWRAVVYRCYRNSAVQSVAVAAMQVAHRLLRTWQRLVTLYIAPTRFVKNQFVAAGIAEERIVVKPHFVSPDPGFSNEVGDYCVFVGQLAEKKGIRPLLEAWKHIDLPLKIVGDGPLSEEVRATVERSGLGNRVSLLGRVRVEEVIAVLRKAMFLILPSLHHEGLPRVVLESFACGVPVLASRLAPLDEVIEEGRTGLLFEPGDPQAIAETVKRAAADRGRLSALKRSAREEYESKYAPEPNYRLLLSIYRAAIELNSKEG